MACVPPSYIKDKAVDYDREILAILGQGSVIGGITFRPPSLGVWSLWEIIDSPVIRADAGATIGDLWRVIWINHARRDAVPLVDKWLMAGKPGIPEKWKTACAMDREVLRFVTKHRINTIPLDILIPAVDKQVGLCSSGYEMIPSGVCGNRKYLFAGEAYGAICSKDVAESDRLIWDVPMCLMGHVTASNAVANGHKGIDRPKDKEDIKAQLQAAREREARGELHPWQIDKPLECDGTVHGLSAEQAKHPHCVAQWESVLAQAKKVKNA